MIKGFVKSVIGRSVYKDNGEILNELLCSIHEQGENYFDCESQEYCGFVQDSLLLFGIEISYVSAEKEMEYVAFDSMMESGSVASWETPNKRMLPHIVSTGKVEVKEFTLFEKYFTEDGAIATYFILLD